MSGLQDELQEKDRKLDADLKGKLDFFIWHQRFRRGYKAWSDAPIDTKATFLLSGEALSTAESWLLLQPGKFTDGERRYIMRSLAQSTQRAVSIEAEVEEAEQGRSRRGYIPLLAAALIAGAIALPRVIPLVANSIKAEAPAETAPRVAEASPPVSAPVRQGAASVEVAAAGQPPQVTPGAQDGAPVPPAAETRGAQTAATAAREAEEAPVVIPGPHLRRLTALAHERREAGDRRGALQVAVEAVSRVAALEPGRTRDELALPVMTSLFRGLTSHGPVSPPLASTAAAPSALFCDGGRGLVTATEDGQFQAFRLSRSAPRPQLPPLAGSQDEKALLKGAAVDSDCRRIVIPGEDDAAEVWSLETGRRLVRMEGHEHDLVGAMFSPDGRTVLTTAEDKTARLWDAATGHVRAVLRGHDGTVLAAAFSADGRRVATASADRTIRVFDPSGGEVLAVIHGHANAVTGVAFSPDGTQVLSTSRDGTARLATLGTDASGRPAPSKVLLAPGRSLMAAQFSDDGRRVIGLADDGAGLLFDAATGQPLFQLSGPAGQIREVRSTRDHALLLAVGWQGDATIYDAGTGHAVATLTDQGQRAISAAFVEGGREVVIVLADGEVVRSPVFAGATEAMGAARSASGDCLSNDEWKVIGGGARSLGCDASVNNDDGWLITAAPVSPELRRPERKPIEISLSVAED